MDLHHIFSAAAGIIIALGGIILSLCSVLIELIHPPNPPSLIPRIRPLPKRRRQSVSFRSPSVAVSHIYHSDETLAIDAGESGHSDHAASTRSSLDVHPVQEPPKPRRHSAPALRNDGSNKLRLFHRHSTGTLWRSNTASSTSQAPRTDPYSAPYNFPLPGSREAERYTEKVRRDKKHLATILGVVLVKKRSKNLKKRLSLL